jgi:hypothetical protein
MREEPGAHEWPEARLAPSLPVPTRSLLRLPEKHRDTETFAARLSWQQSDLPFGEFAPVAGVLGVEMRGEAGGEEQECVCRQ